MSLFLKFAGLNLDTRRPDEALILRFRRPLKERKPAPQILVVVNELLGAKGLLQERGRPCNRLRKNGPELQSRPGKVPVVDLHTASSGEPIAATELAHDGNALCDIPPPATTTTLDADTRLRVIPWATSFDCQSLG